MSGTPTQTPPSAGRPSGAVLDADVLIVGAGPVGLTLAMDLSQRGVQVLVLEMRRFKEPPSVKCNHVSSRTMEQFRRLGVAPALRAAGLPDDYPNDVVFRTSFTGTELSRIPIPGRSTRFSDTSGPDGWWPTPEPPHRINQIYLEPLLLEHAAAMPGIRIVNRVQLTGLSQTDSGVQATALSLDDGQTIELRARYLIGCDGGRSMVRKAIGAQLAGTPVIMNVQSTFIRAPGLLAAVPGQPAWGTYAINPRRCGTVFAIDGRETWLIHNHLAATESVETMNRDRSIRDILGVGADFRYEVLSKEDWVARRLVADRFRDRRVFICGDAAHLWVPYAGYGMNAGIADALNLSWHLSAHLRGWAAESVLDAYQLERQPITEQVSQFAMNHAMAMSKMRSAVPAEIEDDSEAGAAARARIGRESYELNVQQFCCAGLNFGYYYDSSPLIHYDGESAPGYTMGGFTASTVPGCRAPHFWLRDGRSLYDAFGSDYTLLRTRRDAEVQPLIDAARVRRMPMTLLDVSEEALPAEYRHALLLCRPDQHIAWRGMAPPPDPQALVDRLCAQGSLT